MDIRVAFPPKGWGRLFSKPIAKMPAKKKAKKKLVKTLQLAPPELLADGVYKPLGKDQLAILAQMKNKELKAICKERKFIVGGKKVQLIARIAMGKRKLQPEEQVRAFGFVVVGSRAYWIGSEKCDVFSLGVSNCCNLSLLPLIYCSLSLSSLT
jgi:hypothetical protein